MAEYISEKWKIESLGAFRGRCEWWTKVGEGGGIVSGCVGDVVEFVAKLELYERLLEVVGTDGCEAVVCFWCSGDWSSGTGWSRGHDRHTGSERKGDQDVILR